MAGQRISLTLDPALVAEARRLAGRRGLSSYVNEALRTSLQSDRLARILGAMDREAGPVPQQILDEVRAVWPPAEST